MVMLALNRHVGGTHIHALAISVLPRPGANLAKLIDCHDGIDLISIHALLSLCLELAESA
jgi:hypothetical protein